MIKSILPTCLILCVTLDSCERHGKHSLHDCVEKTDRRPRRDVTRPCMESESAVSHENTSGRPYVESPEKAVQQSRHLHSGPINESDVVERAVEHLKSLGRLPHVYETRVRRRDIDWHVTFERIPKAPGGHTIVILNVNGEVQRVWPGA